MQLSAASQASALMLANIPTFSGSQDEDLSDFMQRFKLATLTLSDEHRCLAITKAMTGSARNWLKTNIKDIIKIGDWAAVKKRIDERFGPPHKELKYIKRLAELNFSPESNKPLSCYVDDYYATYIKAHPEADEKTIVQNLHANLPASVKKTLNLMTDIYLAHTIGEYRKIVQRYEHNIVGKSSEMSQDRPTATFDDLRKLISEMKEGIKTMCVKR